MTGRLDPVEFARTGPRFEGGRAAGGEFVRKVRDFVGLLSVWLRGDGQNMWMLLPNGSRIVVPSKQSGVFEVDTVESDMRPQREQRKH